MRAVRGCWPALLLAAWLPAQEAAAVDVHALARQLRAATATESERVAVVEQLLAAGDRGAVALLEALALESTAAGNAFRADATRVRAGCERRARIVLLQRMGRDGDKRVGTLRHEILARSRADDLSHATVAGEIDPRLGELRALLTVDVSHVLAATPALAQQLERARAHGERLVQLWQHRVRADAALQDGVAGRELLRRHPASPDPRALVTDLEADLARFAERATPIGERDAQALLANEALRDGVDAEEKAGVLALNRTRVLLGLPVLAIDVKLCAAARDHSKDMADLGFFSHTSPVAGKETFAVRAARAGTSASAENIAFGQSSGADAIRVWWYSPGHHRNMLSNATRVGLGRHQTHWTQMLGD